jgi:hypothetical protein
MERIQRRADYIFIYFLSPVGNRKLSGNDDLSDECFLDILSRKGYDIFTDCHQRNVLKPHVRRQGVIFLLSGSWSIPVLGVILG